MKQKCKKYFNFVHKFLFTGVIYNSGALKKMKNKQLKITYKLYFSISL